MIPSEEFDHKGEVENENECEDTPSLQIDLDGALNWLSHMWYFS
jgi:hypothetical protein